MRLIDKALQECKENKIELWFDGDFEQKEEYIVNNYCPMFFEFAKALKPYKVNPADKNFCLYNDASATDYSEKCNECWNRTLIVG